MVVLLSHSSELKLLEDVAVILCRCADFVLLNKTDMMDLGQLDSLKEIIASLNPMARVPFVHLQPLGAIEPFT